MSRDGRARVALIALALVAITFAAYSGVLSSGFVKFDDNVYVTENARVLEGLNAKTAAWALTSTEESNWHPLTWLSHLLDVSLFGLDAGMHHLTSLLLHAANAVLLFLLLQRMTGALWRSALASALFAVHPLHVESVAWIAERKDVLCTLFWLLTTAAWVRYTAAKSAARYALVIALFALGLMAKPMLVTLPVTLLLLDVWPLHRKGPLTTRLIEKAPLFAMSAASSVVTFVVQQRGGAVQTLLSMTFGERIANAAVSYVSYIEKTVWPAGLAVFYPFVKNIPAWRVAGATVVLIVVTAAAVRLRARMPYLAFGWLWYLATVVPVIGLVQVGGQSMADRYSYAPLIGIFVAAAWGLAELARSNATARFAASGAAALAIAACVAATRAQVAHWSDSTALFERALAVTKDNWLAHNDLGLVLFEAGKTDESIPHYVEALRITPDYVEANNNFGNALEKLGRRDEAIAHYKAALRVRPDYARVHNNLGVALSNQGKNDEAIAEYREAIRLDPGYPKPYENLAISLSAEGRTGEAIEAYEQALRVKPDSFASLSALGLAYAKSNRVPEAIDAFQRAIALKPDAAEVRNNLAGALAVSGRLDAAIEQLREAIRIDPSNAEAHFNLGGSLFQSGRYDEAIVELEKTVALKPDDADAKRMLAEARAHSGVTPDATAHSGR
jgi:tetratricopeptide (TPR) repeat protein